MQGSKLPCPKPLIPSPGKHLSIFLLLVAALLASRIDHFASIPDASWAVFFIGGFYLRNGRMFMLLFGQAVLLDYIATQHLGVSAYCLSPAYPFLLPAYASLWLGGRLLARHHTGLGTRTAGRLGVTLLASVTLCFLLSDGSFYWLSGRHSEPSMAGWLSNAMRWYPHFLSAPFLYVGLTAVVHCVLAQLNERRPVSAATTTR